MNREKVIQTLEFYRDVEKAVRLNCRIIKNLENQYYNSICGTSLDGLPHSKGGVSSCVEKTAADVPETVNRTIGTLEKENKKFADVKAEILKEINSLSFTQKSVVFDFYINGRQWDWISSQINYSVRQCKNIRNQAIDNLGCRFESNKIISLCIFL